MTWWMIWLLGATSIGALILVARRWGASRARVKSIENQIKAARTRKAIDREIQNLSPSELADRLRRGL